MDRERERERDTLSCFMIGIFTAVGLIVWVGGSFEDGERNFWSTFGRDLY